MTKNINDDTSPRTASSSIKLLKVRQHILVGTCGTMAIEMRNGHWYEFQDVFAAITSKADNNVTVHEVIEVIDSELRSTFANFDRLLQSGSIRPNDLTPPPDVLLKYFVAGYENGTAKLYSIEMDIDWTRLHLESPKVIEMYPAQANGDSYVTWVGEYGEGAAQVLVAVPHDPIGIAARNSAEFQKLLKNQDLSLDESARAVCRIIDLERRGRPQWVGYPYTIDTIIPGQPIGTRKYEKQCSL